MFVEYRFPWSSISNICQISALSLLNTEYRKEVICVPMIDSFMTGLFFTWIQRCFHILRFFICNHETPKWRMSFSLKVSQHFHLCSLCNDASQPMVILKNAGGYWFSLWDLFCMFHILLHEIEDTALKMIKFTPLYIYSCYLYKIETLIIQVKTYFAFFPAVLFLH